MPLFQINSVLYDFVGRFLNDGQLFRAEKLSKLFDIQVPDLGIIKICRELAEEYITILTIPESIKSMIKQDYTIMSQVSILILEVLKRYFRYLTILYRTITIYL